MLRDQAKKPTYSLSLTPHISEEAEVQIFKAGTKLFYAIKDTQC